MPQPISIPPLIPLPGADEPRSTVHDDKEDIFATLFSPATPRASPTPRSVPDGLLRPAVRHSRSASVDSDFGSFVSVPSSEDPLHQVEPEFSPVPFSPAPNFEFFDRFTEYAKVATEKNKRQILGELLENEADPGTFLRLGEFNRRDSQVYCSKGVQDQCMSPLKLSSGTTSPAWSP